MDTGGKPSTGQILLLATSSALTAVLYSVYKKKARDVARLKEARKISINEDLKCILAEAPGKCIPYAVVEGVVRSVKETLNSQFVDNCKGVIERLTLKEKKMVWNRTTHLWNDCEKVIHQRTNTVPFELGSHDDTIPASVRVVRPLDASELDLETTYERFHPAEGSLSTVIGHFISGERPQGVRETEEMLRLGAAVTGVGELVLDNSLVRLQPPKQGFQYFLSRLDYESLLAKQEGGLRFWKVLTLLLGIAACSTLIYVLWKQYGRWRARKRELELLKELKEQRRRRRQAGETDVANEEEEESVSPDACAVCLSRPRDCIFLQCGHVCSCGPCYQALPKPKKCPICRAGIERVVSLYNS